MTSMKLVTKLLAGTLVIGGLGVSMYTTMAGNELVAAKTNELVQTIDTETTTSTKVISVEKAKEIALDASKGGQVTRVHLEEEYGQKEYEIEIINQDIEYDVDLDAVTGKILKMDQDSQDNDYDYNDDNYELQNVSPKISLEEAKKIALTKVKGTVVEVSVDDDYQLVYEVEINTNDYREAEVEVDAMTGDILTVEMDD